MVSTLTARSTRWCKRCRINEAPLMGSNVCGSCADDLRDEEQADIGSRIHEAQRAGRL